MVLGCLPNDIPILPDKKDIGNIMKQRIQSNSPNSKRIDKFVPLLVKAPIQQGGSGDACRFTGCLIFPHIYTYLYIFGSINRPSSIEFF